MQAQKRGGFTLIELMVAMALTMFIMVILSQAFVTALETFAAMKGIGDMQRNLRTAGNILKNDLGQDHLEGKRRLSDLDPFGNPLIMTLQPQAGFFAMFQGSPATNAAGAPYFFEGNDANGVPSYRATNHVLYMTVKRKGNRPENFFTTPIQTSMNMSTADLAAFFSKPTAYDVNPNTQLPIETWAPAYAPGAPTGFYASQWAEVVYYLVRTGSTDEPNNPASILGTPIYGLYRAQFVMVPDGTNVSAQLLFKGRNLEGTTTNPPTIPDFGGLSCRLIPATASANPNDFMFFSPTDASAYVAGQTPAVKRVIPNLSQFNRNAPPVNNVTNRVMVTESLLLPSVISFQIQIMPTGANAFQDVPATSIPPVNGVAVPPVQVYDTALFTYSGYTNNTFGLKAIQITLRVWDPASRQTRQMTIVQDL